MISGLQAVSHPSRAGTTRNRHLDRPRVGIVIPDVDQLVGAGHVPGLPLVFAQFDGLASGSPGFSAGTSLVMLDGPAGLEVNVEIHDSRGHLRLRKYSVVNLGIGEVDDGVAIGSETRRQPRTKHCENGNHATRAGFSCYSVRQAWHRSLGGVASQRSRKYHAN